MTGNLTFVLVAGEASGDQLGAGLVKALRQLYPNAQFLGIAGPAMQEAGCEPWFQSEELAVMGLAEVLGHLPRLLKLRAQLIARTVACKPICYIGVDAPDFNLPVARKLKRLGIPTVHYVSPSVWAWRQGRAKRIAANVDLILTLFPHEPAYYRKHGGNARFVGHPLADAIPMSPDQGEARRKLGLNPTGHVLAVLPGSRMGEVKRLGKIFLQAAAITAQSVSDLTILVPLASAGTRQQFEQQHQQIAPDLPLKILDGQASIAMVASNAVLLASGTAALEAMLCKRPMVIAYRIANLTYVIVKFFRLLSGSHYSLPNVLAGREVAPEILQFQVTADNLSQALIPMLTDADTTAKVAAEFATIHQQLRKDASASAALAIAELIRVEVPAQPQAQAL